MDYVCQLRNTASAVKLKKLDSVHGEDIRIYIGAFKISLVEILHVGANDPPLELKMNELGLRFMLKLNSPWAARAYAPPLHIP